MTVILKQLRQAEAQALIHDEYEALTEMIRQSLERLDVTEEEIERYIEEVRQQRYLNQ